MNCAEKNMRTNNLLQFIHQVIIEFRFRKFLAQERFKSNLEFRYQIIVSSIKFRKGLRCLFSPLSMVTIFLLKYKIIFFSNIRSKRSLPEINFIKD